MGMFLSCARENPCIDAFCWDVQTAGMAQEESDIKGETDLDGFLSEIERFPWNPTLSPTVSVTDLKTDRSVFISVGLAGSQKVSYWVGYIYPVQKRFLGIDRLFRRVEMYETERMDRIIPIVKAFFGRDDQELRRRLAPLSPYLRVKESGGWSAYMDKKQQIVKQKFM